MRKKRVFQLLPFPVIGLLLLLVPLLRDFHFESAMLAGIIGCFWAAVRTAGSRNESDFFTALEILGKLYLIGIPLFVYALFTGCLTFNGFAFWIFTPIPSVFFGATVGRLNRKLAPKPKLISVLILLLCAVGILLVEFFSFPQVYFYNHVWGVWPGPVYDEAVPFSESFLFFRWITFLWILLLWMIPGWNRNLQTKLITILAVFSLMFSYLHLDEMRIISPAKSIRAELKKQKQTEHFDLYFDENAFSEKEIDYWAQKHEFYFNQITEKLELDWPEDERIRSYLYAHAWQKKKITGAKFTSYVPIWLDEGQLHIAKQQLQVLPHELVHVLSRQFGNRLFNGSLSIGLIEGVAEAIVKDASAQSTLHQIIAAEKPYPDARQMKNALSISGFYGKAGAISYTTTGSFVEYLLNNYPVQYFKDAYAGGNFEEVYNRPLAELVSGWHQKLDSVKIDSTDKRISEFIFAQRSLFQKPCPHFVSAEMKLWDDYRLFLAEDDTLNAYVKLDQLFELYPQNNLVFAEWARSKLHRGKPEEVANHFSETDTLLTLQIIYSDALFLQNEFPQARNYLNSISERILQSNAANFKYSLSIRQDTLHWDNLLESRYLNKMPNEEIFKSLNLPTKWVVLQKSLEQKNDSIMAAFSRILLKSEFNPDFFDIFEEMTDRLIYIGEAEMAKSWIEKVSQEQLRRRYIERLKTLEDWLRFSEAGNG